MKNNYIIYTLFTLVTLFIIYLVSGTTKEGMTNASNILKLNNQPVGVFSLSNNQNIPCKSEPKAYTSKLGEKCGAYDNETYACATGLTCDEKEKICIVKKFIDSEKVLNSREKELEKSLLELQRKLQDMENNRGKTNKEKKMNNKLIKELKDQLKLLNEQKKTFEETKKKFELANEKIKDLEEKMKNLKIEQEKALKEAREAARNEANINSTKKTSELEGVHSQKIKELNDKLKELERLKTEAYDSAKKTQENSSQKITELNNKVTELNNKIRELNNKAKKEKETIRSYYFMRNKNDVVSCGGHASNKCNNCIYASNGKLVGSSWCNGDCRWNGSKCVRK